MWPENKIEKELSEIGINLFCGIDECGRGPGAGPLTMAAVILPVNHRIEEKYLKDSKKLTPKRRKEASKLIHERALDLVIEDIPETFIDIHGIQNATRVAVRRLIKNLKIKPDMILIDGKDIEFDTYNIPYMTFIKGEDRSQNIAGASIACKVWRDEWMKGFYHENWPQYGFNKHVGYLTKQHIEALEKYGPCPCHRKSYMLKGKLIRDYGKENNEY